MEQEVIILLDTDAQMQFFLTLCVLEIFGLSLKTKNGLLTFLFEIGH